MRKITKLPSKDYVRGYHNGAIAMAYKILKVSEDLPQEVLDILASLPEDCRKMKEDIKKAIT